jgi:trans-aconitate methyltransferase
MDAALYEAHERLEDTHWWFEGRRRVIHQVLKGQLAPRGDRRVLDVGCGTGGMFRLLKDFGSVEGVESSPDARARAQRRFPSERVSNGALPGDLPEGQWELITLFDVLEHVDEASASLEALRARLTPGGQLVVTVPAFQFLWSRHDEVNHHQRRYTEGQLVADLEAAGLRVTYSSYYNTFLFPAVLAARAAQRLVPALARNESADLEPTREPLNRALGLLFGAEALLLRRVRLPVGVSLIAVAQPR